MFGGLGTLLHVCLLVMVVLLQLLLKTLVIAPLLRADSGAMGTGVVLLRTLMNVLLLRTANRAAGTTKFLLSVLVNTLLLRAASWL